MGLLPDFNQLKAVHVVHVKSLIRTFCRHSVRLERSMKFVHQGRPCYVSSAGALSCLHFRQPNLSSEHPQSTITMRAVVCICAVLCLANLRFHTSSEVSAQTRKPSCRRSLERGVGEAMSALDEANSTSLCGSLEL
ncbi:hypothetical protein EJ06DRAFT_126204 [Trichodelitschia bisporula]|uniref:Uncharacterized protein n=1 Tax=Trichodelitschia bisporula TaxID=703511 RepID=A0A6G1HQ44_9PEZI|nr:hypothetical protein EJ06DRAFT_126204 [Trichodelitschia bisporula]